MMVTSGFRYPVLTPQLEFILSKATETFKNDPYVKEYCKVAREIEAQQQGLVDEAPVQSAPAPAVPADSTSDSSAQTLSPIIGVQQAPVNNSDNK